MDSTKSLITKQHWPKYLVRHCTQNANIVVIGGTTGCHYKCCLHLFGPADNIPSPSRLIYRIRNNNLMVS